MTKEDVKETEKQGRPWKNEKTYKTFKSADKLRNEILEEGKYQAKVKCAGEAPNYRYIVRTRETDEFLKDLQAKKVKTEKKETRKLKKGDNPKRKEKISNKRQRD